jgi:hypothetical protein
MQQEQPERFANACKNYLCWENKCLLILIKFVTHVIRKISKKTNKNPNLLFSCKNIMLFKCFYKSYNQLPGIL